MSSFEKAYAFVKKWEGGLVDNPADTGGITNYGVSLRFLQAEAQKQESRDLLARMGIILPITANTIRNLTPDQARAIFKGFFWQPLGCEEMPELFAIAYFDSAVNMGPARAGRFIQQAINAEYANIIYPHQEDAPLLVVDGQLGPASKKAMRAMALDGLEMDCVHKAVCFRGLWYNNRVAEKPDQAVFLKGWLARVNALSVYIKGLAQS